eukprot:CAMPEP_0171580114 /NCGR_PEP_ID=MMETSP0961-20121227/8862_1 /TAXON_ID=87120 /ORGANISM="Aurantiochytrium limacinum, Strain ATCCMYA-1381" /LENGTH=577 /DNA_ID=CAMNT_0012136763 /DNA_START=9 /DNA_END=1742 /DNA_ORIENTATION=+
MRSQGASGEPPGPSCATSPAPRPPADHRGAFAPVPLPKGGHGLGMSAVEKGSLGLGQSNTLGGATGNPGDHAEAGAFGFRGIRGIRDQSQGLGIGLGGRLQNQFRSSGSGVWSTGVAKADSRDGGGGNMQESAQDCAKNGSDGPRAIPLREAGPAWKAQNLSQDGDAGGLGWRDERNLEYEVNMDRDKDQVRQVQMQRLRGLNFMPAFRRANSADLSGASISMEDESNVHMEQGEDAEVEDDDLDMMTCEEREMIQIIDFDDLGCEEDEELSMAFGEHQPHQFYQHHHLHSAHWQQQQEQQEQEQQEQEHSMHKPMALHAMVNRYMTSPERPSNPMAQMLAENSRSPDARQLTLAIPQGTSIRPIQSPTTMWPSRPRSLTRSPHPAGLIGSKRTGEASPMPMLVADYFSPRKIKRSSLLDSGRSNSLSSSSSVGSLGSNVGNELTRSTSGFHGKFSLETSSRAASRNGRRDLDETSIYGSDVSMMDDNSEILYTPRDYGGERGRTFSLHSLSPSPRPTTMFGTPSAPKSISASGSGAGAGAGAGGRSGGSLASTEMSSSRSVDGLSPLRDVMRHIGL